MHDEATTEESAGNVAGMGETSEPGRTPAHQSVQLEDGTQDHEIVAAMIANGGSFVQALGECFRRADGPNFAKLRAAFPEYWTRYGHVAESLRARWSGRKP